MNENTNYLEFGEILIDTATSLCGYLLNEIEKEKPDFILHSHLAVWGRLVANHFNIQVISLFSTFIMDKRIMLSYFRKHPKNCEGTEHLRSTIRFSRKLGQLYERLQLKAVPDIWDIYVNHKGLNLSFILENFQPDREILGPECKFIGFPGRLHEKYAERDVIYVSMGTILNRNLKFYKLCLKVLANLDRRCILVVGKSTNISSLGEIPDCVQVVPFADQVKALKRSMIFLTRGGMASVHEAIFAGTPMVVIPEMAEQQMTAQTVESLGIGIHLPVPDLSEESMLASINRLLQNHSWYTTNIRRLVAGAPEGSPGETAAESITSYLRN
jgi:MGT family glycosyltransferase